MLTTGRVSLLFLSLLLVLPHPARTAEPPACEPYAVPFRPEAFPEQDRPVSVRIENGWLVIANPHGRLGALYLGFTPARADVHGTRVVVVAPGRGLTLVDLADLRSPRVLAVLAPGTAVDGYVVQNGLLLPTLRGVAFCSDAVRMTALQKERTSEMKRFPLWIAGLGLGPGVGSYLHSGFMGGNAGLHLLRQADNHHYIGLMLEATVAAGPEDGSLGSVSVFGYRYLGDHLFADVAPGLAWASGCIQRSNEGGECLSEDNKLETILMIRVGWMLRFGSTLVGLSAEVQAGPAFFMGLNLSLGLGWGTRGAP
ncbi:MAG: hypothetical protein CVU59_06200 [Deltaproteobacteria bacterium HGW-Deltaproteobacteria-17]|nr:MAG: hypothetical protein CVU59_06200 [Deltaproteobacteria bacterium HGW-Deltaproteobacteria-17]